jgi:hypothetical protein
VCVCAEEEKEGGVDCIGTRCPAGRKKERVCALLLCVRSRRTQAAARQQGSKALRLGATHLCPPSRRFCLGSTVHTHPPFPREKKVNEAARWAWIFLLASIAPVSSGLRLRLRQRTAAGWAKQHLIDFFRPLTEIAECDDVQDSGHKQKQPSKKQQSASSFVQEVLLVLSLVPWITWCGGARQCDRPQGRPGPTHTLHNHHQLALLILVLGLCTRTGNCALCPD